VKINSCVSSCYTNFKTVVFVVDLLIWKDFIMLTTVLHSIFLKISLRIKFLSLFEIFRFVTFSFGGNNLSGF
jgi:hypothetical protein